MRQESEIGSCPVSYQNFIKQRSKSIKVHHKAKTQKGGELTIILDRLSSKRNGSLNFQSSSQLQQISEHSPKAQKRYSAHLPVLKSVEYIVGKTKKLNQIQEHIISNYLNAKVRVKTETKQVPHRKKKKKFFRQEYDKMHLKSRAMQDMDLQDQQEHYDKFHVDKKQSKQKYEYKKNLKYNSNSVTTRQPQEHYSLTQNSVRFNNESKMNTIDSAKAGKNYSLKEEPLKHYAIKKMEDKRQEWSQINPFTLQTYFIHLKKVLERSSESPSKVAMINNKNKYKPIPERDELSSFIKSYVPKNREIKLIEMIKKDNFEICYDPEELYFGQIQDNLRHGNGVLMRNNYLFEGEWKYGKKVKGFELTDLGSYFGQFFNDKKEGKGEFNWVNGEYYSGEWKNGKKHGGGLWRSIKGDCYMGDWKNGNVEGQGIHTTFNGQKYQGEFSQFLKHGWGRQVFPNGDIYEGNYKYGYPHGKGFYKWRHGTVYEGQFLEGFRTGRGCLKTQDGLTYLGQFVMERAQGICEINFQNGDVYQGEFRDSKKNGKGVLVLKNSRIIYDGLWQNDQFIDKLPKP